MNVSQARHAKAMARKIREHAQAIVDAMSSIEHVSVIDAKNVPVSNIRQRFTHDMGFGVQDHTSAIEDVITDTLPDLESQ